MQAGSVKYFTDRLDALQKAWNCSDVELCSRVGFSRQLLYLMRSGEQEPSKKTVRLLEIAEQETARSGSTSSTLRYAMEPAAPRRSLMREKPAASGCDKEKLKAQIAVLKEALRIAQELLEEKP